MNAVMEISVKTHCGAPNDRIRPPSSFEAGMRITSNAPKYHPNRRPSLSVLYPMTIASTAMTFQNRLGRPILLREPMYMRRKGAGAKAKEGWFALLDSAANRPLYSGPINAVPVLQ